MAFLGSIGKALGLGSTASVFSGLGSSLVSGGLSMLGGMLSNQQSAKSIQQQQAFQADMSGTAYQRAVKDMEAAGLNPMLAYSQGGASTPSGGSYTASDVVTPALNSAFTNKRLNADVNNLVETNKKIRSDTALSQASQRLTDANVTQTAANVEKIRQDQATSRSAQQLNHALSVKAAADALSSQASARQLNASAASIAATAATTKARLPAVQLQSQIDSGTTAKVTGYINKVLEPINQLIHGGSSAYRAYQSGQD